MEQLRVSPSLAKFFGPSSYSYNFNINESIKMRHFLLIFTCLIINIVFLSYINSYSKSLNEQKIINENVITQSVPSKVNTTIAPVTVAPVTVAPVKFALTLNDNTAQNADNSSITNILSSLSLVILTAFVVFMLPKSNTLSFYFYIITTLGYLLLAILSYVYVKKIDDSGSDYDRISSIALVNMILSIVVAFDIGSIYFKKY